mmetsp:Transcript_143176/g.202472  ORF Transcript_143176/g.202472 Transcript_143176/m.202472 type:complete len:242 (-) Transcript_143176:108-833(-)
MNSHQHVGFLPGRKVGERRKEHRAPVAHLLEGATTIAVAFAILALFVALHRFHKLSLKSGILRQGARLVAMTIQATVVVAHFHLHDVSAELNLCGSRPLVVPTMVVETLLHVQHRTLLVQLLERAAAGTVALTVAPTLVMAIHLLHQLNLKISILRHGACLVASAIVAAPGMAHLHLHHVGAELSVRRGRLPVMMPTVVVMVVVVLLLCVGGRILGTVELDARLPSTLRALPGHSSQAKGC